MTKSWKEHAEFYLESYTDAKKKIDNAKNSEDRAMFAFEWLGASGYHAKLFKRKLER